MAEFDPGIEDDFDPHVDNPDTLAEDPNIAVAFTPVGNARGDGYTLTLPAPTASQIAAGQGGDAVRVLAADVTRAVAQIIALDGPVSIANDPSQLVNGVGARIPQNVTIPLTTIDEVWAAIPPAGTVGTVSVWTERVV